MIHLWRIICRIEQEIFQTLPYRYHNPWHMRKTLASGTAFRPWPLSSKFPGIWIDFPRTWIYFPRVCISTKRPIIQTTAPKNKSDRFSSSGAAANKQMFLKGGAGRWLNPSVKFPWNFVNQHPLPRDLSCPLCPGLHQSHWQVTSHSMCLEPRVFSNLNILGTESRQARCKLGWVGHCGP